MSFVCSICHQEHLGLPARTFLRPDHWAGLTAEQQAQCKADDDLCRTSDGRFFVRGVLILPLLDGPEQDFEFGAWVEVSGLDFRRFVETFNDPQQSRIGPIRCRLANELENFPGSVELGCRLDPQDSNARPTVWIEEAHHALYRAQQSGMRYEDALRIVHWDSGAIDT